MTHTDEGVTPENVDAHIADIMEMARLLHPRKRDTKKPDQLVEPEVS